MSLKTILLILTVAVIAFTAVLALGYFGVPPFTEVFALVQGAVTGFDFNSVIENPSALATTAATGIGSAASVGALGYSMYNQAKQQASAVASTAKDQLSEANKIKEQATSELNNLKSQMGEQTSTIEALKSKANAVTELETKFSTVTKNYNDLLIQKDFIQTQLTDTKSQLQKALAQIEVLQPKVK